MGQTACTNRPKLRHDPLQIFRGSRTPAGLYARQKWLGESGTAVWQQHSRETVSSLMEGQSAGGSWNESPFETIRRLFGLHLTVRDRIAEIDRALDWLIGSALNDDAWDPEKSVASLPPDAFGGLPFSQGRTPFFFACATLFLAMVFQRGDDPAIAAHYRRLSRWVANYTEKADVWPEQSNALRSLIVHPHYSEDGATVTLVDHLERVQHASGCWPAPIPFYRTVNALAHLRLEAAHRQWIMALKVLCDSQSKDGSWGTSETEWNTFLVVHALKKKSCL